MQYPPPAPTAWPLIIVLALALALFTWRYRKPSSFASTMARLRLPGSEVVARGALIEYVSDLVLVLDRQGLLVDFNPAAQRALGIDAAQASGRPVHAMLCQEPGWLSGDPAAIPAEIGVRRAGDTRYYELSVTPIKSRSGRQGWLLVLLRDITARKQMEQAEHEQRVLAEALRDTAAALSTSLHFDQVLDIILANVGRVVPHDAATIALADEYGYAFFVRARGYAERGLEEAVLSWRVLISGTPHLAHMADSGEALLVPDTSEDPDWLQLPHTAWVRSYASMPIHLKGQVVGFLSLDSATRGFFTPWHTERLHAFADQAAIAIENARLYDVTRRRADQMTSLYEIGLALASAMDVDLVLRTLLSQCLQLLPVDAFAVDLYEAGSGVLENRLHYEQGDYSARAPRNIHKDPGVCGAVLQSRRTLFVPDTHDADPALQGEFAGSGNETTRSYLAVPLVVRDQPIGVLSIRNYRPRAYSSNQVHLLETIASQAAIAVENARLYAEAREHARELEEANRLAQDARALAESASRAKSIFLASMSHELRTPLNAILGFSELMARDTGLSPEQRYNLATINRSGEHLLELINDVLDMAKIESGRMTLQEAVFDLHRMLDNLMNMFRLRAGEKGLALIVSSEPGVPQYVLADERKLRQVLINLIGNAIKFTGDGRVSVHVSRLDRRREGAAADGCRLRFEVQDTGPGIPPQDLEAIFQPFVQSRDGRKYQEGTGLGLPISREFVRLMGGRLIARSEGAGGQGALLRFDIPVRVASAAETAPAPQEAPQLRALAAAPGQPRHRLLVAEDRDESRALLVQMLERLGFDVRAADDGLEAVNACKEWRPHLVWMDMRMPVIDAAEATRRIKAECGDAKTVVIALTAGAFEDEGAGVPAAGCDDFVRKPLREADIVEMLGRHLGARFVYEESAAQPAESGGAREAEIAVLPGGWLRAARRAAGEADAGALAGLIERLRPSHPQQAAALAEMAGNFDYDGILDALESAPSQTTESAGD